MKGKILKGSLTVFGAVAITTLGIFASDSLQGIDQNLAGLMGSSENGICNGGSVHFKYGDISLCVDIYEASPGETCPNSNPQSVLQSEDNANSAGCYAASRQDAIPWTYVSLPQAQRMCAGAGKRLPTSDEWYRIALGTQAENCVTNQNLVQETGSAACISSLGIHDTVGNVWEWVDATIKNNMLDGRELPPEGYVSSVDSSGIAITSADIPEQLYGSDYFWSKSEGVFGLLRGGFYGSDDDAGLYAANASVPTSFASPGVGFRCVEDV